MRIKTFMLSLLEPKFEGIFKDWIMSYMINQLLLFNVRLSTLACQHDYYSWLDRLWSTARLSRLPLLHGILCAEYKENCGSLKIFTLTVSCDDWNDSCYWQILPRAAELWGKDPGADGTEDWEVLNKRHTSQKVQQREKVEKGYKNKSQNSAKNRQGKVGEKDDQEKNWGSIVQSSTLDESGWLGGKIFFTCWSAFLKLNNSRSGGDKES